VAAFSIHATSLNTKGIVMFKFNHLNLPTSNVADLSRFFMEIFSFRQVGVFGNGKLSWLINDEGFEIILLQEKHLVAGDQYPAGFPTGFIVPSWEDVNELHAAILGAGFEAPAPDMIQRGGPPAYGFYAIPPGGVTVEVSTWA
jgi:hypothetical protein